ncbi:MAG: Smr/MutS family protein [Desulfonatronovibrionaceae bacterium]
MQQPFKKLQQLDLSGDKNKAGDKKPAKQKIPSQGEQKPPDEETALFLSAMSGVKPLQKKGRHVSPAPEKSGAGPPESEDPTRTLEKLVNGEINFDLTFTDEHVEGYVQGLDPKIFRRLKSGRYSIEGNLDLHGMNAEQARVSLLTFLRDHYLGGSRCVLVIPGRGKGSPLKMGVLKKEIQTWLTREPLKRIVLAFCTSLPKHGGTGAIYILLRKYRKDKGKIVWDKYLMDTGVY